MLNHSDPIVQALIETLEYQRDNAVLLAAQRQGQIAALTNDLIVTNTENARLREALEAAALFQRPESAKLFDLDAQRVADQIGGTAS